LKVLSGDVMDLAALVVETGAKPVGEIERMLSEWDDPRNQFGRPSDFTTVADTLRRRRQQLLQRHLA
jgi:hypothetical protein